MPAKRIIPCLDIHEGRTVKGVQFQNLRDSGDPVTLAKKYSDNGADEIVFLDISATTEARSLMLELIRKTAEQVFVPLTVGGGIRSVDQARELLSCGADKVSVNSAAVKEPRLIKDLADAFGSQAVVVAIDCKLENEEFWVTTHAGSLRADLKVVDWAIRVESLGAGEILLTSMQADGTRTGFDLKLCQAVRREVHIPIIASGGAGSAPDFVDLFMNCDVDAALAASIFHMDEVEIDEVKHLLRQSGLQVRRES